jgi:acetyl-CoA synthetase
VEHTHASYPAGHLSTMYWIGLEPGDVHLNISSPGWAKHAWSNVFAPWIAEATVLVVNFARFDPEVIEQVERAWGVRIRDGFGQTETTVQIANTPGQEVRPGRWGARCPAIRSCWSTRPPAGATSTRTGDIGSRDDDGYITYVGRADDVFKASDYRISPFELESVLIEHPAVAEAAVVPSPDPVRLAVPKAYVVLAAGHVHAPGLTRPAA